MTSDKIRPDSEVRRQLELGRERVDYDVEAGLLRHRELVTQGAAVPTWADGTSLPRTLWRTRALSGLTVLVLGGAGLFALRQAHSVPADEVAALSATANSSAPAPSAPPMPRARVVASADSEVPTSEVAPSVVVRARDPEPRAHAPERQTSAHEHASARRAGAVRASAAHIARAPASHTHTDDVLADVVPAQPRVSSAASSGARVESARAESARAATGPAVVAIPGQVASARAGARATAVETSAPSATSVREVSSPRAPVIVDERPEVVVEMQELSRAEGLLAKDPTAALSLVRASIAKHPKGFLVEERRYVEVMAMLALRRVEEARLLGREFVRAYPQSPFRRRVDTAVAGAIRTQ